MRGRDTWRDRCAELPLSDQVHADDTPPSEGEGSQSTESHGVGNRSNTKSLSVRKSRPILAVVALKMLLLGQATSAIATIPTFRSHSIPTSASTNAARNGDYLYTYPCPPGSSVSSFKAYGQGSGIQHGCQQLCRRCRSVPNPHWTLARRSVSGQ